MTGLSLIYGVLSAVETLAPQALGAGRPGDVGLLCQRGVVFATALLPVAMALWFNARHLLVAVGQPPEVAELSQSFLRIYATAMPPLIIFEALRRFLYVQNIIMAIVYITGVVGCLVHPIMAYILVKHLGFIGAPLAVVSSQWLMMVLGLCYVRWAQVNINNPRQEKR